MEAQESEMAEEVEKIVENIDYSSNQIVIKIISYTLVVILLLFLLKKFLSSKNKNIIGEADGVSQQRSSLDGDFRKNKKNKRGFGNSLSQIRYWYKKYLVLCYRKNMDVSMSDSSQTILDKSTDIFIDNKNDLEEKIQNICTEVANYNFGKGEIDIFCTITVGISNFDCALNIDENINLADRAMYTKKHNGKNGYYFCN